MTLSSLAIHHVLATYQRYLRQAEGHHAIRRPDLRPAPVDAAGERLFTHRHIRERFGDGAVREFHQSSIEAHRMLTNLM